MQAIFDELDASQRIKMLQIALQYTIPRTKWKLKRNIIKYKVVMVNQRIKLLQIALQYTLPGMKQATDEVSNDLPLFV